MKEFKLKVSTIIKNNFNINIFGENGCGKSTLISSLFQRENNNKLSIPVSLTSFVIITEFFNKISLYMSNYCSQIVEHAADLFEIKTWSDLYEILEFYPKHNTYIVIDEIDDIQTFLYFKKQMQKLFAISNCYPQIKLILISNFDMTKSELRNLFDFSSFIAICFPSKTKRDIENVIENKYNSSLYSLTAYRNIVTQSIANFEYPFMNYNEYIYCIGHNLNCFGRHNDNSVHMLDSNDNDSHCDSVKDNDNHSIKKSLNKIALNGGGGNDDLNRKLRIAINQQIQYAPIHMNDISLDNNTTTNQHSKKEISMLQQGKNLTESLSRCQKLLLLSAFLASEISPNNDINVFKSTKRSHKRKKHKDAFALKAKSSNLFNIHRIIAIYSSLQDVIDSNNKIKVNDINIELIADIGTLANLTLLRVIKSNEYNVMGRKFICCIGIDFADKIANDFNIQLTDFLHYDTSV